MTVQVTPKTSLAPLLIAEKTVRHNIVPLLLALNKPASVTAPVPVPAGKEAT